MPRPPNPNAKDHTIKIDHEVFTAMRARAEALDLTSTQYIARLIKADAITGAGLPLVIYPMEYQGRALELKVAETPPPYLTKKK